MRFRSNTPIATQGLPICFSLLSFDTTLPFVVVESLFYSSTRISDYEYAELDKRSIYLTRISSKRFWSHSKERPHSIDGRFELQQIISNQQLPLTCTSSLLPPPSEDFSLHPQQHGVHGELRQSPLL